jgi:hypothetical protein
MRAPNVRDNTANAFQAELGVKLAIIADHRLAGHYRRSPSLASPLDRGHRLWLHPLPPGSGQLCVLLLLGRLVADHPRTVRRLRGGTRPRREGPGRRRAAVMSASTARGTRLASPWTALRYWW